LTFSWTQYAGVIHAAVAIDALRIVRRNSRVFRNGRVSRSMTLLHLFTSFFMAAVAEIYGPGLTPDKYISNNTDPALEPDDKVLQGALYGADFARGHYAFDNRVMGKAKYIGRWVNTVTLKKEFYPLTKGKCSYAV